MIVDASIPPDGAVSQVGRTGLAGFCDHYKECGGSYFSTAQDCIDEGLDYWGSCRSVQLDAFSDCMIAVSCAEWGDPTAYDPRQTPCASQWMTLENAPCP